MERVDAVLVKVRAHDALALFRDDVPEELVHRVVVAEAKRGAVALEVATLVYHAVSLPVSDDCAKCESRLGDVRARVIDVRARVIVEARQWPVATMRSFSRFHDRPEYFGFLGVRMTMASFTMICSVWPFSLSGGRSRIVSGSNSSGSGHMRAGACSGVRFSCRIYGHPKHRLKPDTSLL